MPSRRLLWLLSLLRGLHGLRHSDARLPEQPEPEQLKEPDPDFFVCEWERGEAGGASCSEEPSVPSRLMDDLLLVGYQRMQAVVASGHRPLAVHIGADGLNNGARWTDMHLYSRVLMRAGLPNGLLRLAFVEPVEAKAGSFWHHVEQLPANASQVTLHTATVDGHCKAEMQVLYRLSLQAGRDFGFYEQPTQGWVSSDRQHPLNVVAWWSRTNRPMACPGNQGDCRENFRRLANSANLSSYVERLTIPCLSLQGVVREARAEVQDLSMLVIDAEGLDNQILLAVAHQEDFKPGFLMWEGSDKVTPDLLELVRVLRQKGYAVGIKRGAAATHDEISSDAQNYVAVLKHSE